ncbi:MULTISPECIES: DUF748 domain-containing protein [Ralstonia solanacearum species complex]|uniref:DUF748 domain-containing protein n=1 Tax=Ralstonia solanacearum species complex TaxID=3116862 RepID=UPI000E576F5E|nr:DUF748 domain-containing protein [Ralstonia solanacearum]AXV91665.1 hypothetical protein CJO79_12095 [Ralstonia solanacearum]AXW76555.1 hypothetical protein CJO97_12085 [Ralstonia solanacearum]BEU72811.1 DUF748 domain-containing protein [Ralstonia pseudosolanacearum]
MTTSPDSPPDLQPNTTGWRARLGRWRNSPGWQRTARFGDQVWASRRTRRIGLGVLIFLVVFGLLGAVGGPPLLHHLAETQLSKYLERPVTVGKIRLNPYTLRLEIDQLHIAERDGKTPFVDIGHLHVNAAWSSIFRRAPVIEELTVDAPRVRIVRTAEQRFNFSDIVDKLTQPEIPPKPKSNEPARFVFANLQLNNGAIQFVDQPLGAQHTVDGLRIGVPFLASLPADVDIFVQPLLAARIDGAPLYFAGKTKPFAQSLESSLNIRLDGLDLPRYLGYVPGPLPVAVPQGKLTTDLTIDFQKPNTGNPVLRVHGTAGLDSLEVTDAKKAPLVAAKQLRATLSDVRPLDNVYHLDTLSLDGVRVDAVRAPDGSINFAQLGGKPAQTEAKPAPSAPAAQPKPLDVAVGKLQLANSSIHWRDATTQPAADLVLDDLHGNVAVRTLGGPTTLDVGAKLASGGTLNIKGSTSLEKRTGELELKLDAIKLTGVEPYLRQAGAPQLQNGALSADGKIALEFGADKFNVRAEPLVATLADLALAPATRNDTALRAKQLRADIKSFDLAARTLALNEVRGDGLQLDVLRKQDGSTVLTLLDTPQQAAAKAKAPPAPAKSGTPAEKPWAVTVQTLRLDNGAVGFEDQTNSRPVKVRVEPLNVLVQNASTDLGKPVDVQIGAGLGSKGKLDVRGNVVPQPLKADLRVNTQNLSLAGFDPYLDKSLNAAITSALLTMDGRLALNQGKALTVSYQGNATIGNVRLQDRVTSDDFLRWRSLALNRIQASYDGATPRVRVGALALSTFYARIIINPNGRLNLQDIRVQPTEEHRSLTQAAPGPASSPAATPGGAVAAAPAPATNPASAVTAGTPASSVATAPKAGGADLRIDAITLQDGNIRFTDNFVKPNYTANLTTIGGSVGTISTSAGQQPADVTLRGSVDGTAPVDIHGKVNPLAPTAFVDLSAKADDIELTNLTPYSAKYAGYPITKGKLTMDLHYLLDQGKLSADNHIFIDQLTFGDRVESKDATNLPVRLAVALLKNSRGEIDVRVPVSGSLDDPQFSLGGVILRAFANLIVRAVTAPFSLLANAFGGSGGEELGYIEFDPGTAAISQASMARIDKLATALKDRPALKLDIIGRVDPATDRDGLRREAVNRQIREQKLKDAGDAGEADSTVKPEEMDKYLERAYKAAKFPKPRNVIGLAKSLPPDEMRKLMETNVQVTDSDLRELAQRRANAVHVALAERVEPARLFVVAPKLDAEGIKDKGKTSRVDFSLK